jgi:hypothetical protein
MVALLFITPLYCTSLAFGFYFRVVVTIRARALWLSRFWLRLDRLIKPCFLSASPLLLLSLTSFHAHYESLHRSLPSASLARFHVPMRTIGARLPTLPALRLLCISHCVLRAFLYPCARPLST